MVFENSQLKQLSTLSKLGRQILHVNIVSANTIHTPGRPPLLRRWPQQLHPSQEHHP